MEHVKIGDYIYLKNIDCVITVDNDFIKFEIQKQIKTGIARFATTQEIEQYKLLS